MYNINKYIHTHVHAYVFLQMQLKCILSKIRAIQKLIPLIHKISTW